MLTKEKIIEMADQKGEIRTSYISSKFSVSRQYANSLIFELVEEGRLVKIGSTRSSFYVLPKYLKKHKDRLPLKYQKGYLNEGLEEHKVLNQVEESFSYLKKLPENIQSIFMYAFSEMLNNAIEHSSSVRVGVEVAVENRNLSFVVKDSGVGVFRNIMKKRKLRSELEAIQDLMKGKTTTMPKSHSGEGIFFTSKAGDFFMLDSFGYQLIVDNRIPDVFVRKTKTIKRGTKVVFRLAVDSKRHLNELFNSYTNQTKNSDYGFDKTKIQIKLYTIGGVHISRSQARRVLSGLEKFKVIVFDFNNVPVVGQAFADEIFRVFHARYPKIKLEAVNMNEPAKFMVKRAISRSSRRSVD